MFAHFISQVLGLRTAAGRSGKPNVRGDFCHEAAHVTQRSKPAGVFQQFCGATGAEQPDRLGRPVDRQERCHRPRSREGGATG